MKYAETLLIKIATILPIATIGGSVLFFIEKYVFKDWDFAGYLLVLIVADTLLGVAKNIKNKTVSSSGFANFFIKLLVYSCVLISLHVLNNFTVNKVSHQLFDWSNTVVYTAIIIRELISIFENVAEIKPNLIPAWILKILKSHDSQTGEKLTNTNPDNE